MSGQPAMHGADEAAADVSTVLLAGAILESARHIRPFSHPYAIGAYRGLIGGVLTLWKRRSRSQK